MKLNPSLLAFAAAAAFVGSAQAVVFTGTTLGGPTFTRAVADFSVLSAFGVGVRYQVTPFTVTAAGSYVFQNTALVPINWDNFTFVYKTAFNAASPLINGVAGNDDNPTIGLSGFTTALLTGVDYFYVTTGFERADAGTFSASITGPGNVILAGVPEPSSYALMGLGLAGVLVWARRRQGRASA